MEVAKSTSSREWLNNAGVIATGTAISIVGLVSYSGLQYLFLVIIARAIGPVLYGLFNIGLATVNVVVPMALMGLNFAALRYVARCRAQGNTAGEIRLVRRALLFVVVTGTCVSIALLLLAEPIAHFYDPDGFALAPLLRRLAPAVPLSAVLILLVSVMYGQRRITAGVILQKVGQPATALLLTGGALWIGKGVIGIIQSYVLSLLLSVLIALYLLRLTFISSGQPVIPDSNFSMRPVLKYSLPFIPISCLRQFGNRLEVYLLGFLSTTMDAGIFSAVAVTAAFITLGLKSILSVYSALASELHAVGDTNQLKIHLQLVTRWAVALSLPPLIVMGLFGRELLGLFSETFTAGYIALLIVALGQFVKAMAGPIEATLNMAGYSRLLLLNNMTFLALNVALDWWLIGRWGLPGAAIGTTISLVALNLALAFEVQLLLGIHAYSRQLLHPLLAGILAVLAVWPILTLLHSFPSLPRLFIGSMVTTLLYYLLLWIVVPRDDRDVIKLVWLRVKSSEVSL